MGLKNLFTTVLIIIIFLAFTIKPKAQVCTGSLGENIFTEGDFGSGTDNILLVDPGIAPGYNYELNPPPEDGFYTLSNNTGLWPNLYPTWLEIRDNSSDPNGYMMVVNASFTAGLFYEQEVTGLCENTLYEFSADVINLIRINTPNHILPNVSFLINDVEVYSTGEVPQDEVWHTYGFTFTTDPGQTSVRLSLRNNAPGGIGNDLALDNISFQPCGPGTFILPVEVANICEDGDPITLDATIEGDQYDTPQIQWQISRDQGATWTAIENATDLSVIHNELEGGFYYYRFILANSLENLDNPRCRAISNVKVVHVIPKFYSVVDSVCEGLDYLFGDNAINASGTYVDSLKTSFGCDSIVTLQLTVVPDTDVQAMAEITDLSCHNIQDGQIRIIPEGNINGPFEVIFEGQPLIPDFTASNLAANTYTYAVIDRFGCRFSESISVNSPDSFIIYLGNDTSILSGESFSIDVQSTFDIVSVNLFPESISCNSPCDIIQWTPIETTTVILEGTSPTGCLASDTLNVTVRQDRSIEFPNIFSPNGDGINDQFNGFGRVPNIQLIESLMIFDRWGNLLHEEIGLLPNESNGWDGRANGEFLNTGVYLFVAKVRFIDGEVLPIAGDLMLVR